MANRTTADKVKVILTTELTNETIEAYIGIASGQVNLVAAASDTLTANDLAEIERWLTAHLISITKERRPNKEKIGEAEAQYTKTYGQGLQSTEYGQMAAQIDTSGTLAQLGKKRLSIKSITSFE